MGEGLGSRGCYRVIVTFALIVSIISNSKIIIAEEIPIEHNSLNVQSYECCVIKNEIDVVQAPKPKVEPYIAMNTPSNNSFKSFMDSDCIKDKSSDQYKLKDSYELSENYGIWMVNDRYCIAVGSYYTTKIGTKLDVVLESGTTIKCILADCKDDAHTDEETHRQNDNGSIVEFIVNTSSLPSIARKMGDISYVDEVFSGEIIEIRIYE